MSASPSLCVYLGRGRAEGSICCAVVRIYVCVMCVCRTVPGFGPMGLLEWCHQCRWAVGSPLHSGSVAGMALPNSLLVGLSALPGGS
jgi:hypothetical protein